MPILPEFRKRFVELVDERELKHTLIAEQMGVPYDVFSKIKNYGIVPTPKLIIGIADYFETSVDYLLARVETDCFVAATRPATFHQRLDSLRMEKNLTYYALGKNCI